LATKNEKNEKNIYKLNFFKLQVKRWEDFPNVTFTFDCTDRPIGFYADQVNFHNTTPHYTHPPTTPHHTPHHIKHLSLSLTSFTDYLVVPILLGYLRNNLLDFSSMAYILQKRKH
jgi:hypothetical protein